MLQHFPLPHFQRPTLGLRTECSMRSDRQRKQPGYSLEAPIPMSRSGEKATYHERVRVCRNDIQSTKSKDHQAASFKSCLLERRSVRPHDMRRMRMNMTRRSTAVNQCDDITFRHDGVHQWLGRRFLAGGLSLICYGSTKHANSAFHPSGVGK